MTKTTILFYSSPNYSGHAKALYDFINKKYNNKFDLYWAIDKKEDYVQLKNTINCIMYPSAKFNKTFKKIDVIFTTHGQLMNEKRNDQIYVNLWHGIGPKKAGYMLDEECFAPQDKTYYLNMRRKTDYMICPSYFFQYIFSTLFKYSAPRVLPIAYPKLDEIVYSNGKENLYKVLGINTNSYKKVILYTPTFKKGLGRKDEKPNTVNIFDLGKYDENELLKYLKKNNYLLLIKYHPSEETKYKHVNHNNVKYITEDMLKKYAFNINNILNGTDILITDYSSLGVEYTILDKPVIYLNNNIEEYKKNRGIIFENGEFWMENKTSNIEELLSTISKLKKQEISKNKRVYFGDLKDGGCENIVNYFFDKSFKLRKNIKQYKDEYDYLLDDYNNKVKKYMKELKLIEDKKNCFMVENDELREELKNIYNSKSWKILEKMRKILRKK